VYEFVPSLPDKEGIPPLESRPTKTATDDPAAQLAVVTTATFVPPPLFTPELMEVNPRAPPKAKVLDPPPAVAVRVTVCDIEADTTVAVNAPLVDPAATVKLAGTVTFALLLDRATLVPPEGAAALRVTVHATGPAVETLAGLQLRLLTVGGAGTMLRAKVWDPPPAVAVRVTVCDIEAETTVAVNVPLVDPAATVKLAGTVTLALLLDRATLVPPEEAAALRVTVHATDPAPETLAGLQLRLLTDGAGAMVAAKLLTVISLKFDPMSVAEAVAPTN
jgi:hypothetical protein